MQPKETGSTDHGPGQPTPGASVPQAADQPRSGPQLAHSNRERSTEPLPDTHQTRPPGTPAPGLTWGFEWQVLGSNQRRLSRRFYRALPGTATQAFHLRENRTDTSWPVRSTTRQPNPGPPVQLCPAGTATRGMFSFVEGVFRWHNRVVAEVDLPAYIMECFAKCDCAALLASEDTCGVGCPAVTCDGDDVNCFHP